MLALALLAAACGDTVGGPTTPGRCAPGDLSLIEPGILTIGTGDPVFEPWMSEQDPTNGRGFESAVAYATATRLGFGDDEVKWVRAAADEVLAPGPKRFDFGIEQHVITEERATLVDFSVPYYTVRYTLVANPGSAVATAETTEDLRGLRLGAALDMDAITFIDQTIQPAERPTFFDTTSGARAALDGGEIDALVYDLPSAHFITAIELPDAVIVAQIDEPADPPEQYGLVFGTANPLLECVDAALTALEEDGTLAALERMWLTAEGQIRTIGPPPSPGDGTASTVTTEPAG